MIGSASRIVADFAISEPRGPGVTLQAVTLLGIDASIMLTVLALGLDANSRQVTHLVRHPSKLVRSLIAMDVIMPLFVLLAIALISPPGPVQTALAALSVSPVPPLLPKKTIGAGGAENYSVGLLVAAAVIALAFVPLAVEVMGAFYGVDAHISVLTIAQLMLITTLGPLAVGMAVRRFLPDVANHIRGLLSRIGGILLLVCAVPILVKMWPQAMSLIGNGTLFILCAFVVVGLTAGHILGGPDPDDRTVLAIATSSRHPGAALAITAASFPAQKLAMPAVILYLLVNAVVALPYIRWRKHRFAALRGPQAVK